MFNRLFGKDKQEKPSSNRGGGGGKSEDVSASLGKLDSAIDLLEKRENVLEKKIEQELAKAKAFYTKKNTQAAMQCMKRKKLYEEQMMNLGSQKANLETLKFNIQNQNMNQEVLQAQISAKDELKKGNKKMNADKIEDVMDELMDEMDKANQVSEALRQPLDNNFVDEDEMMMELEMEMEGAAGENIEEAPMPEMPKVPTGKLPPKKQKEKDDEEALRQLEAELAM